MKNKKIKWIVFLLVLFFPAGAWSSNTSGKNLLQNVSSELSEGKLTVRFEFNKPVLSMGQPVFDRTFIRVKVPKAFVRPAKRFYYTGDSRLPQIFVSQIDPGSLQLQFVLGEKLPNLRENFHVEDQGRSLVFHFFKKEEDVLSEFLARAASREDLSNVQELKTLSEPEERITKDFPDLLEKNSTGFLLQKVDAESPTPVAPSEKNIPSTPPLSFEENNERDSGGPMDPVSITVKTFAMFALVLGLMFLIFYLFKKFVLKNTIFGGNEKFVRVLGTGFLGPKKNIILVEVVGEILVLGASNDNISLLTHIQDKEKVEQIKAAGKEMNVRKFWSTQKSKDPAPGPPKGTTKPESEFANYLKEFSGTSTEKEKSVEEVTELIRKNLGKRKAL